MVIVLVEAVAFLSWFADNSFLILRTYSTYPLPLPEMHGWYFSGQGSQTLKTSGLGKSVRAFRHIYFALGSLQRAILLTFCL